MLPHLCIDLQTFDFLTAKGFLKTYKTTLAMYVLRTWCNAWLTSRRMHENPSLLCLFGCGISERPSPDSESRSSGSSSSSSDSSDSPFVDSTAHYMVCPLLWNTIAQACGGPNLDGIERFGCSTCPQRFHCSAFRMAVACHLYHTIKMGHLEAFLSARRLRQRHGLRVRTLQLAQASRSFIETL